LLARDVLLEQHRDVAGAFGDFEDVLHGVFFFDLFLEEPQQEVGALVVLGLDGDVVERADRDG